MFIKLRALKIVAKQIRKRDLECWPEQSKQSKQIFKKTSKANC